MTPAFGNTLLAASREKELAVKSPQLGMALGSFVKSCVLLKISLAIDYNDHIAGKQTDDLKWKVEAH